MGKFKGKYRIESTRATWWNYGWDAAYFITICTKNREHYFGKIGVEARLIAPLSDKPPLMQLSEIGQIAQSCWDDIPNHFPFAKLGEFVVMPNHVHGIVIIDKSQLDIHPIDGDVDTRLIAYPPATSNPPATPQSIGGFSGNKNPMLNDNLSRIIRWFKGRTTFESRKIHPHFAWQSLFHDHIIRNDEAYQRITTYIRNNPVKWHEDKFY